MASAFSYPNIIDSECALLAIPVPLVPFVLGALGQLQDRRYWETDNDWQAGYEAIAAIEAEAMTTCLSQLIASQDRIYRLLDWSLNGRVYEVTETDPLTIEPAIPDVPNTDISSPGIVRTMVVVRNMLSNALNGDTNSDFSITPSLREQLQAIIDALGSDNTDLESIISQLETVAILLG